MFKWESFGGVNKDDAKLFRTRLNVSVNKLQQMEVAAN